MLVKLLHQGEHLTVDNSRMGILENLPLLRRSLNFLLVLEGLGGAAEIHRIAAVFLFSEYIRNRGRAPVIRNSRQLAAISADIAPVLRGCRYFCRFQAFGDLRRPKAIHAPSKDLSHGLGRFLIHKPAVFVFRVFQIPVGRICGQRCAGHSFALEYIAHLLAGVLGVPFVE